MSEWSGEGWYRIGWSDSSLVNEYVIEHEIMVEQEMRVR